MATKNALKSLARDYNKILKAEERREELYARIVEIVESGEATGAEVARALGLQRQRIYQIVKDNSHDMDNNTDRK